MKRILALALVLMMALSVSAFAEIPEYVNTASETPMVNGDQITLSVAVQPNALDNIDKLWFWEYCRQVLNINFDVTAFTGDVRDEKINLMFASDSMPDMVLGCSFSVSELVTYGQVEGMLLALNDYIDPVLTPNIVSIFEKHPEYKGLVTAQDGKIYSMPCINPDLNILGIMPGAFMNMPMLAETGMEMPTTLDELHALLLKVKELHPESIPLAGGRNAAEPTQLIWTALGATTDTATTPGFLNGKVSVLCGEEVYGEYLKYMNTLFNEGLIDPDYYTIDTTVLNGELAEGKVFIASTPVYNALPESFQDWQAISPLTSSVNDKQVWQGAKLAAPGAAVINANTEYAELCMRFVDFFFSPKGGIYAWTGPMVDTDDTLGMVCGWYGNEQVPDVENGKYSSAWEYVVYAVSPFNPSRPGTKAGEVERIKFQDPEAEFNWDLNNPDNNYRASKEIYELPYVQDVYPTIYFDDETQTRLNELSLVIEDYVNTETAKFITGVNSLDNLPAYYEKLNALGYEEYVSYYADAYETYLANLG